MTEASTWYILKELEHRLCDSIDDQDTNFDLVLTRMPMNDNMLLYNTLSEYNKQYTIGVGNGVY